MDMYDFVYNWQAWRHSFHYHAMDWYIPEESAMPMAAAITAAIPTYGSLASSQFLPTPTAFTMKVDERYGNVVYFPNNSFIALLEDGGLMFVDGWGSEFLMSAGSIRRSCAGDIWDVPGKNLNVWAGLDIVNRANGSVDVSANLGNIRVKAQGNVTMLAGNGGCGGFLFESRAIHAGYEYDAHNPAVSGFVVRCKTSPIVLMGQDMLLTTRYPAQGNHIVIDSGTAKTIVSGTHVEVQAASSFLAITGGVVHEFWSSEVNFGADTSVTGKLVVTNCGMFGVSVAAPQTATILCNYPSGVSTTVNTAVTDVNSRNSTMTSYATSAANDVEDLVTRAPAIETVQFVFRDATDYNTVGLSFYEPRWHQIARLSGESMATWTESACTDASASTTYPHPGEAAWISGTAYAQQPLALHDQLTDLAINRGSAYEEAAYTVPNFVDLDGNLPVILNPT
jgi:hypothetical protein